MPGTPNVKIVEPGLGLGNDSLSVTRVDRRIAAALSHACRSRLIWCTHRPPIRAAATPVTAT